MSLNIITEEEKPWYHEGLRFKCTGCGQCCTGAPGYTWVSDEEIQKIAERLNLSIKEFSQKYLRYVNGRYSLREHPETYDCVFLKNNRCSIYQDRPKQCRTYPWWPSTLKSKKEWNKAASQCEGINHPDAPLINFETIHEQLRIQES